MDPVSLVVSAVVAGAATALKDTAAQAVKDAYGALRQLLVGRHVVVEAVERKPGSEAKQDGLREDLVDTGAAADPAVLEAAEHLVELVRQHDTAGAKAVGIDIDRVNAGFVRIKNIKLTGPGVGVDLDDVVAPGGIEIEGVDVDARGDTTHP